MGPPLPDANAPWRLKRASLARPRAAAGVSYCSRRDALLARVSAGGSRHLGDELPATSSRVLTRGSWSAAIVDELKPDAADVLVEKHRMSGFWDTPLDSILRNMDAKTLFFAGVNADQCVLHTLADANFLGYDTILIEDCAATTSPDFCWQATLYNVKQIFGFTVESTAIPL